MTLKDGDQIHTALEAGRGHLRRVRAVAEPHRQLISQRGEALPRQRESLDFLGQDVERTRGQLYVSGDGGGARGVGGGGKDGWFTRAPISSLGLKA